MITCGIFIKYKDLLLITHATKSSIANWSIPKGLPNEDETDIDAAIREVLEETSLNLINYKRYLIELKDVKYTNTKKTLKSWFIDLTKLIVDLDDDNKLRITFNVFECTSLTPGNYPENDIIKFEKIENIKSRNLLHDSQMNVLEMNNYFKNFSLL